MIRRIWILLLKEWREALKGGKTIWLGTVALPIFLLGFSMYMLLNAGDLGVLDEESLTTVIRALFGVFVLYFMLFPMIIPNTISVYAIVSEKEQKSLEPLLTTPLQTWELFVGKVLAAVIPALLVTWVAFGVFVSLIQSFLPPAALPIAWREFGFTALTTIFLFAPFAAILVTLTSMAIATRVGDARAAQILSSLVVLPITIWAIYYLFQNSLLQPMNFVWLSLTLAVVDLLLLKLCVKFFQREEILTRWR